jgi:hypothetical protein
MDYPDISLRTVSLVQQLVRNSSSLPLQSISLPVGETM